MLERRWRRSYRHEHGRFVTRSPLRLHAYAPRHILSQTVIVETHHRESGVIKARLFLGRDPDLT